MQNVSNTYKSLVGKSGRVFVLKIYTNITLTAEQINTGLYEFDPDGNTLILTGYDVMQNSLQIKDETTAEGAFNIGGAIIGELSFELENSNERFSNIDFEGVTFDVRIGLLVEQRHDGTVIYEWIKKGVFTTEEIINNEQFLSVTAFDNMAKLDRPYSESALKYPASLQAIMDDACQCCGVAVNSLDFPNKEWRVADRKKIDESATFRDIVSYVAQLACSFVRCDADGRLDIRWYEETDTEINEAQKISGSVKITGVTVISTADESLEYIAGDDGYVLAIEDNPLAQIDRHSSNNPMFNPIWGNRILDFNVTPFDCTVVSNPATEAGDIITIYDRFGKAYRTPITGLCYQLDSKTALRCDAETTEEKKRSGNNPAAKIKAVAKQEAEKRVSAYDVYAQNFNSLTANSMGFYETVKTQDDGSKIVYQHDKPTMEESKYIWKKSVDSFAVSSDGGITWGAGFDKNGNAVLNVLAAQGIVADWVKTGVIRGANNANAYFDLDNDELSCTKVSGSNSGYYYKLDKVVYGGIPYFSGMYAYSKFDNSLQGGLFNLDNKQVGVLGVNGVSVRSNALNSTLCNEFKMSNDSSGKGEITLTRLTGYTDVTTEPVLRVNDKELYFSKYYNSSATDNENCYVRMYKNGGTGTTATCLELGVHYPYSGSSQERTNFIRITYSGIQLYVNGTLKEEWK